MPDEPELTPLGKIDEAEQTKLDTIDTWVLRLLHRCGIQTVDFAKTGEPKNIGLINVPGKYISVISAMHQALVAVACGDPLPEILPPERSTKKKRR